MPYRVGIHYLIDCFNCDKSKLEKVINTQELLNKVVVLAGLSDVGSQFKQFEPYGASGIILLEESHISAHTWPEYGTVVIDIFSCKPLELQVDVINFLKLYLNTNDISIQSIDRGVNTAKIIPLAN